MCYYVLHLHAGEIYYQLGRQSPPDHKQKPSPAKRRSLLNFLAFDFALKTMPKVQPVFGAFLLFRYHRREMQVLVRIHEPGGSFILAYRVGKTMKSKNVFSFERIFEAVRQEANGCTRTRFGIVDDCSRSKSD